MEWWGRGSRRDHPTNDPCTGAAAARAEVEAPHPGVQLLLSQRCLGWVERPQELGVRRRRRGGGGRGGGRAGAAAAAAAHLAGLPAAVGRGRRLALVGDGGGRGAHFGEQRRRVGEGVAPGALQGAEAQTGQEAAGRVAAGRVLLLQLLLVLQLNLLLVAQLPLQPEAFELVGLVSTEHF